MDLSIGKKNKVCKNKACFFVELFFGENLISGQMDDDEVNGIHLFIFVHFHIFLLDNYYDDAVFLSVFFNINRTGDAPSVHQITK